MFEQWLAEDSDLLMLDPTRLREDFEDAKTAYTRTGRKLFENFLKNA